MLACLGKFCLQLGYLRPEVFKLPAQSLALLTGRRYHRVGHDHRPMVFRGDGAFAAGGARCERYWTIRDGRLMIAGDDGRLTMDLVPTADGGWEGAWLMFEKMAIRLELTEWRRQTDRRR